MSLDEIKKKWNSQIRLESVQDASSEACSDILGRDSQLIEPSTPV